MHRALIYSAWITLLFAVFYDDARAQQQFALRVRVLGSGGAAVAGATLNLTGAAPTLTDNRGEALFSNLSAGARVLMVQAVGYEAQDTLVAIRTDLVIVVRLNASPIRLDTLVAQSRTAVLRGEILEGGSNRGIPGAVLRSGAHEVTTNAVGFFRLSGLRTGFPIDLNITAIGYLPISMPLLITGDTTIRLELQMDPVGQRLIQQQLGRLQERVNGYPYSTVRTLNRADVLRHAAGSALDVLRFSGYPTLPVCLVVDDRVAAVERDPRLRQQVMLAHLNSIMSEQLERIEVLDRGSTIRLYTYEYVRTGLPRQRTLTPILRGVCS